MQSTERTAGAAWPKTEVVWRKSADSARFMNRPMVARGRACEFSGEEMQMNEAKGKRCFLLYGASVGKEMLADIMMRHKIRNSNHQAKNSLSAARGRRGR